MYGFTGSSAHTHTYIHVLKLSDVTRPPYENVPAIVVESGEKKKRKEKRNNTCHMQFG